MTPSDLTSHPTSDPVLVTGGSGYLGTRVIADLLAQGTPVRATVRSLDSEPALREAVRRGGADDAGLDLVVASLTDDAGWDAAASGVAGVYHLASPMTHATEDPELVVAPARLGSTWKGVACHRLFTLRLSSYASDGRCFQGRSELGIDSMPPTGPHTHGTPCPQIAAG